eukprot:COSAG02_NODE_91_length_37690_cov_91.664840_8_plen_123_part_00
MTYVVQLRVDDDGARHLLLVVLHPHDTRARHECPPGTSGRAAPAARHERRARGTSAGGAYPQARLEADAGSLRRVDGDALRARAPQPLRDIVSWSATLGALAASSRRDGAVCDTAAVGYVPI